MENTYGIVMGLILLFPWSLVGMMVAGAVWGKLRPSERLKVPAGREYRRTQGTGPSASSPRI